MATSDLTYGHFKPDMPNVRSKSKIGVSNYRLAYQIIVALLRSTEDVNPLHPDPSLSASGALKYHESKFIWPGSYGTQHDFDDETPADLTNVDTSGRRAGGWLGCVTRRLRGKTKAELGFLTNAYKPQFYWFEIVECTKKLLITGVLMQAVQGSASQLFFGISIAFFCAPESPSLPFPCG